MKRFREGSDRSQQALLPRRVEDYVSSGDLVRFVDTLVDELDLSEIEDCYSAFGRPAYSPRVLVKLLLYGKMRGIRSSRELARAAEENLRFIFLLNNERPDFRTIIRFRKWHHEALARLLGQTIVIGLREQLIDLEHVCIDGTKIRAFAGRDSFYPPEQLEKRLHMVCSPKMLPAGMRVVLT